MSKKNTNTIKNHRLSHWDFLKEPDRFISKLDDLYGLYEQGCMPRGSAAISSYVNHGARKIA